VGAASRVRADILLAVVVDLFVVVAAYVLGLGYMMLDSIIGGTWFFSRNLAMALPIIATLHLLYNNWAGAYGHVRERGRHRPQAPSGRWAVLLRVVLANIAAFATFFLNFQARAWEILLIPFSVILYGSLLSLFGMGLVRFRRSEPDAPVANRSKSG
jgi:hypothetical protein